MVAFHISWPFQMRPERPQYPVRNLTELEHMLWNKTRNSKKEQVILTDGSVWTDICVYSAIDSARWSIFAFDPFMMGKLENDTVYHYHTHPHVFPSNLEPIDVVSPPSALDLDALKGFVNVARSYGKKARGRIVERFGVWEYWPGRGFRDFSYRQAVSRATAVVEDNFYLSARNQASLVTDIYRRAGFNVTFKECAYV